MEKKNKTKKTGKHDIIIIIIIASRGKRGHSERVGGGKKTRDEYVFTPPENSFSARVFRKMI